MICDRAPAGGSNRTTLARAVAGTVLLAAFAGAGFVARDDVSPAAAPRRHRVFCGVGLNGAVAPRRVTLAPLSAARLGVSLAPASAGHEKPSDLRIPLSALIYDPQGLAWTYVAVGPDAYERVAVTVERIDGDEVLISAHLRAGTPVVDAGAPELLGVEYGVGEE